MNSTTRTPGEIPRWERLARATAVDALGDIDAGLASPEYRPRMRRQVIAVLEELANKPDDALDELVSDETPFTPVECRETLAKYAEKIIEEADRDGETGQG